MKREKLHKRVYLKGGGYIKMDVEEDASFRAEMIGVPEHAQLMEEDLLREERLRIKRGVFSEGEKEEIKKRALKINKVKK